MDDLQIVVDEINAMVLESQQELAFKPIKQETIEIFKSNFQHTLNRCGYTDDDINVIVKANEQNPSIVNIVLEDKSHRGKILLEYMDYVSRQE